ncbi:hypothetical protein ACL02R_01410 [Streptomyces sp. MS19]|uniref:hypothetical protein n=1 Tax=Streptomyces sp. MS19 TaxID=3385972 RepID=UPI0039A1C7A7
MTAAGIWLHVAVPVLVTALAARAVWAAASVEMCARWLLRAPRPTPPAKDVPWLVVLLPMLREQAVAPATVAAFTALPYPPGRAAVVVITTERETSARARQRGQLPALAGLAPLEPDRLLGLFPAHRCKTVAQAVNAAAPGDRLTVLTGLFDAQPTTAQTIASLAAAPPEPGGLPLVHLHQPDTGGRKAGQLNHALGRLDQVLGPLGWSESTDAQATFITVYDADACPDARTLHAFVDAARAHRQRTGRPPALIQQQRLPLAGRRPFPHGPLGVVLAGEWIYQLRRSLGIELARVRLHHRLAASRLPEPVRMWARPMVYAVGCGMAVHLPAVRALGGFPEPMEDIGTGHRLSLLGAPLTASRAIVLDEPYTHPGGLANLHALAFTASARPDRHAAAVAHLPAHLPAASRLVLVAREWADEAAWLLGAPLTAAAAASSWWAGPGWAALAAAGVLLHCPLQTARLLALAPALYNTFTPPPGITSPPSPPARRRAVLIAASPLQPFVRLVGPWRHLIRLTARRQRAFGKTER